MSIVAHLTGHTRQRLLAEIQTQYRILRAEGVQPSEARRRLAQSADTIELYTRDPQLRRRAERMRVMLRGMRAPWTRNLPRLTVNWWDVRLPLDLDADLGWEGSDEAYDDAVLAGFES